MPAFCVLGDNRWKTSNCMKYRKNLSHSLRHMHLFCSITASPRKETAENTLGYLLPSTVLTILLRSHHSKVNIYICQKRLISSKLEHVRLSIWIVCFRCLQNASHTWISMLNWITSTNLCFKLNIVSLERIRIELGRMHLRFTNSKHCILILNLPTVAMILGYSSLYARVTIVEGVIQNDKGLSQNCDVRNAYPMTLNNYYEPILEICCLSCAWKQLLFPETRK